jgi:hypothetical protein
MKRSGKRCCRATGSRRWRWCNRRSAAAERLLGLEGESAEAPAKRAQTEWRLDSGWGRAEIINGLLTRGYQVTGKFKSPSRVRKLVAPIPTWEPTTSPGREVAPVPAPVGLARPCAQYAVRTPSKHKPGGYYQAVLFSSRTDPAMQAVVDHYDGRAGMEADLQGDKHGLGLGVLRKRKLAAQKLVLLLGQWAHNILLWARGWLATGAPRLANFGIVRLVQEVWAVPGRVKLAGAELRRVRLRPEHPRAGCALRAPPASCRQSNAGVFGLKLGSCFSGCGMRDCAPACRPSASSSKSPSSACWPGWRSTASGSSRAGSPCSFAMVCGRARPGTWTSARRASQRRRWTACARRPRQPSVPTTSPSSLARSRTSCRTRPADPYVSESLPALPGWSS